MAVTAVTGFTEPFQDTHPFYRGPTGCWSILLTRLRTGSAGSLVSSIRRQFWRSYFWEFVQCLTVTATASGLGTASSVAQFYVNGCSGSGTGDATAVGLTVLFALPQVRV
jgi:hypothetical protein